MKIFMCTLLVFTFMMFLNSVQSITGSAQQYDTVRINGREYHVPVYGRHGRTYIPDVRTNMRAPIEVNDLLFRDRNAIGIVRQSLHTMQMEIYDLNGRAYGGRLTDTIAPQNMDILKREENLIAVYEDGFGFRFLREY